MGNLQCQHMILSELFMLDCALNMVATSTSAIWCFLCMMEGNRHHVRFSTDRIFIADVIALGMESTIDKAMPQTRQMPSKKVRMIV